MNNIDSQPPKVVSRAEWLTARRALLVKEKALTRQRDDIARQRRELPWVKVEKAYTFEGPDGRVTLADLFQGRSQLIVYHFMFGPDWEQGCTGCSFISDHVDGARQHFEHNDVSYVAVSRAPYAKFAPYKMRMGWTFNWVSSFGSDFNFDYQASSLPEEMARGEMFYNFEPTEIDHDTDENHGTSVFYKDANGDIYHTFSQYGRADEDMISAYRYIDIVPKGRMETSPMSWMKRHDEYGK